MNNKTYHIIRPADKAEWLKEREKGIGSSEAGTVLGVNPFETPYKLWRRKKGLDPRQPENEAMRAGHILEGAVATYFEEETGHRVIRASEGDWLAVDNNHDYLRVSPDRTYWLSIHHSSDNKGIVECKTTQLDVDDTQIPLHWFCQLQYQLGVMHLRQGALAWLTRGRRFGTVTVDFDADFYAYMVGRLTKFWTDYIQGDREPPVTTIDDVQLKFPRAVAGKAVEADDKIMQYITDLKSIKPQIERLTRQKKELEDGIKTFMADADTLCLPGTKENAPMVLATWKTARDSEKFNEKKFKAEHADLYGQYTQTVAGSRRFMIK